MTKRALVTGGAGFIGSHVADRYVEQGYDVTVVDDLSSGRRQNVPERATFVEADVRDAEVRRLLAEGDFTVVNHHAAQMDVRVSVARPETDASINLLGLLNLLEGARAGGARRFVFASSGGVVYGESDALPHPETARKLPVSPYGVSKLSSEFYLAAYAQMYGLEVCSLRYANVYGPRQSPQGEAGVVAIFCSRILRGDPLTVYGDGEQTRDYVYVKDVARVNVLASERPIPALATIDDVAFNVGTGTETSVNALARALLEVSCGTSTITHAAERKGELKRSAVDPGKAGKVLGWRPEVSLADGLRATYQWISGES